MIDSSIPMPLAVWLVQDDYDYVKDANYISATQLLQPTRSIVLSKRLPTEGEIDLDSLMAPSMGTALHESIERVWRDKKKLNSAFDKLGYPPNFVDRVNALTEVRNTRELDGYKIGGKFDLVINGNLFDFKSTSVYSWINKDKDEDYILQGSIYKWLNPDTITGDSITICFMFTDWSAKEASLKPDYPQHRMLQKELFLMSETQVENWIRFKLNEISRNKNATQEDMIECTDEELWRSQPVFKYYASGDLSKRATKNFSDANEAAAFKAKNGNKGIVILVPGEPKRCKYCAAAPICEQRRKMTGGRDE